MHGQESDQFYADFEAKFRGSRELIAERLQAYTPILEVLRCSTPSLSALELGCGIGEWLELLAKHAITGRGIDCNAVMIQTCQTHQLQVQQQEAHAALLDQQASSLNIITAFHLAEHLPFPLLRTLISEAHRVLKPGGILILETPNPENLSVGAMNFYMDPTHQRPIPPPLLQFAVQHAGFQDAHILRLQHCQELVNATSPGLTDVLQGVSPDYAVLGIKTGPPHLHQRLAAEAKNLNGLSLQQVSDRFDSSNQANLKSLQAAVATLQSEINELISKQRPTARALKREHKTTTLQQKSLIKALKTKLRQSKRILNSWTAKR